MRNKEEHLHTRILMSGIMRKSVTSENKNLLSHFYRVNDTGEVCKYCSLLLGNGKFT